MAIESIELVSGNTYRVTKTQELIRADLVAEKTRNTNEITAHQSRIDSLTDRNTDIDTLLGLLPSE